jgi:hypothetical protein
LQSELSALIPLLNNVNTRPESKFTVLIHGDQSISPTQMHPTLEEGMLSEGGFASPGDFIVGAQL